MARRSAKSVSSVSTRRVARVARRSELEPIFGASRRFEVGRARGPEGWQVSDAAGATVLQVAAREGPFWKTLGRGKAGSPQRSFGAMQGERLLGVLRLDAVFVDPQTGQMEHRGNGQLLDALETRLLGATLRKRFFADGHLPNQTEPVISLVPERAQILAVAGERQVGIVFAVQETRSLETLRRYELAFDKDSSARERVWVAALVMLGDVWGLEAERRQR